MALSSAVRRVANMHVALIMGNVLRWNQFGCASGAALCEPARSYATVILIFSSAALAFALAAASAILAAQTFGPVS